MAHAIATIVLANSLQDTAIFFVSFATSKNELEFERILCDPTDPTNPTHASGARQPSTIEELVRTASPLAFLVQTMADSTRVRLIGTLRC